jgi:predicted cobalt transporter CbtA
MVRYIKTIVLLIGTKIDIAIDKLKLFSMRGGNGRMKGLFWGIR